MTPVPTVLAVSDATGETAEQAAWAALAVALAISGWVIAQCAGVMVQRFGLSATLVGALMTAVVTSLPELVTTPSQVLAHLVE